MRVTPVRVVLVGLPGAGKTTVGRRLAERLGWAFVDPDADVERGAGLDIAAIVREHGEPVFRELERRAVDRALTRDRVVIAPGGGWAAQPGVWDRLPEGSVVVWLQVSAAEAIRRLEQDEVVRPLLAEADMASHMVRLEGERTLAYSRAHLAVETDGSTPEAVAEQVAARLVSEYGIDGRSD